MQTILLLIIVFLPILAQVSINSTYNNYSKIDNKKGLSGKDIAKAILDKNGLEDINVVCVNGFLTDNYNPKTKTVSLSKDIYSGKSISSCAVAAHEVGHAIQDKENYGFMKFRTLLVPIVNFTSRFATLFIIIGLFTEVVNIYYIGIILLLGGLLFQIITLPVEFNASSRAKKELDTLKLVSKTEFDGTKKVLNAAAFTYIAGFLAMLLQIIRLLSFTRRN